MRKDTHSSDEVDVGIVRFLHDFRLYSGLDAAAELCSTKRITALPLNCKCGKRYAIGITMAAPSWMEPSPEPSFTLPDNCSRCGEPLDTYANVADLTARAFIAVQP